VIDAPIPFMGIPLKDKNNPILVLWAYFDSEIVHTKAPSPELSEFYNGLEEYTGIKCNTYLDIKSDKLPYSVRYVYLTKKIVDYCYSFLNEKEKFEMLNDLDLVLYNSPLIRALRASQFHSSPILYREGEDIVKLKLNSFLKVTLIYRHPLLELKEAIDNSLVHLLGIIPIYYSQDKDYKYIQLENGLWSGLYGVFFPLKKNWKWIWDGNFISLIEFHFISSLTT